MISARTALDLLPTNTYGMLDVRSEGEFATAAIPGFHNAPILRDQERHEVGLCYRLEGQAAAIKLGERLVGPVRQSRVDDWLKNTAPGSPVIVCCWRGGMRSALASEWIEERGHEVLRVEGGYKAL
ncbi:MAG: rhodanese-like domain-containing protein [Pseudobdellovibrionaceae bacterium]|nr:rhodanese-like domain-containing protein [Pseudobdellovibrionaceae bacterium]